MIWRNFFSVRETLSFFHIVWSNGFTFTEKIFREINFLLSNMHFHEFFHIHMYTQCWNDMILPPRIWQKKTLVLSSVASNFSFDHTFHVFEVEMKCRKKINVCNQFLLQCWLKSIAPTWLWEVNKVNLRLFWSLQHTVTNYWKTSNCWFHDQFLLYSKVFLWCFHWVSNTFGTWNYYFETF